MTDVEAYREAVARWLDALNRRGELEAVEAAVHPTIRLERFGFASQRGDVVQIIENPGPLAAWLSLTHDEVVFSVAEGPTLEDDDGAAEPIAVVRYCMTFPKFVNYGTWRMRLADDGRLGWIQHEPDPLPALTHEEVVAFGQSGPPVAPNVIPPHPHPHAHAHEESDQE